jgi:DNA-binding MarR family transcriptional regulator
MASVTGSLSKADYESLAEFRYVLRRYLGFSEHAAQANGVTPQQYQAMLAIEGYPGRSWATVGELAEKMCVAHHSTVGLIDRMEALKLVRRDVAAEDKRRVRVSLTPKGRRLLEKLYRIHRAELKSREPELANVLHRAAEGIAAD